ncbi:hypothetical protein [Pelagibius marinus]|uniref:hypothetical protein n=1 Tax=Pelagibius marinus TaxID=2762760 RepID=UPI001872F16D|nr:hypothetical protein [Pelagibius marinus]
MKGLRWSAGALAVAGVVLATAGCGGPRGYYESGPPRVPAGGTFTIEPGQEVVVYGVRSKYCGMTPPTFETASQEMFSGEGSQGPATGQVYDAGIGQRVSVPCGGTVPVRAIGYRAPEGFEGEVSMVFYGVDQATVTVALPEPEPEEEPVLDPEAASEPAPLPDPATEPTPSEGPMPEGEAGPPESPLEEPPGVQPN